MAPVEAPLRQKRIVLVEPNADLQKAKFAVEESDVPVPKKGQVLVKMVAAPVNPSDFGQWLNPSPGTNYPKLIGLEGAGIVVASGGGLGAHTLVGKKVGVVARDTGTYQQYVVVDAMTGVFKLDQDVCVEDAASFFVNPYTAVGIIDTVKQAGASVFIHTAAASQLGQMLVKLSPSQGVIVVNVVRREEQAEMLRALGAKHVVVQNGKWEDELANLISELQIKVAFDCISGETTGKIVSLLPSNSKTFLYGALSEQPAGGFNPMDLIYKKKQVEGWLLPNWLMHGGTLKMLLRIRRTRKIVNLGLREGGWAQSQFDDVSMEEWLEKFLSMRASSGKGGFTGRKLRIRFDNSSNVAEHVELLANVQ